MFTIITITNAIIHILSQETNEPILNDFELDINEEVHSYLEKHIANSLNSDNIKRAVFNEGMNVIKDVCDRMLEDDEFFVLGSKEVARQLYRTVKSNGSISSGDLIVCQYLLESIPYIAILKMDYKDAYTHEVDIVEEKYKISLKSNHNCLPGINQRIQKCAFVNANSQLQHDLLILDNQISNIEDRENIAHFFLVNFLNAQIMVDSKISTKVFKKETEKFLKSQNVSIHEISEVNKQINAELNQKQDIDLHEFTDRVFKDDVLKEKYLHNIMRKGIEEQFNVDKEWVEKKVSRIKLVTGDEIEITLDFDTYQNESRFEVVLNPDGTRTIIIKNINVLYEK